MEKFKDFVDACIWLETYLEDNKECYTYIDRLGYKLRNIGIISVPILGEIKASIIAKIPDENLKLSISKNLIQIMSKLKTSDKLLIHKFCNIDDTILKEIKDIDYAVTEDDALHLCMTIRLRCQNFITIDQVLLKNEKLIGWLRKNKNLKIRGPY